MLRIGVAILFRLFSPNFWHIGRQLIIDELTLYGT